MKQIKPCHRCKKTIGWWEKRVEYYTQYFMPDGEPSHANDGERIRGGIRKYCYECNADITNKVTE